MSFDQTEAAAELYAYNQLGAFCPSVTCILGPVFKLELQRDGREMELAIEMLSCTCSVATVPLPADIEMMAWALIFVHSKNRMRGIL